MSQEVFYVSDRQWGRRILCASGPYLPFSARACLNHHHWLAIRLREERIDLRVRQHLLKRRQAGTTARHVSVEESPADFTGPVNPEEFTIREFAEKVVRMTNATGGIREGPRAEDDPRQRRPDIGLAVPGSAGSRRLALQKGSARRSPTSAGWPLRRGCPAFARPGCGLHL
jgi:hypothetical protein